MRLGLALLALLLATAVSGPGVVVLAPEGGVAPGAIAISPAFSRNVIAAGVRTLSLSGVRVETWRSDDGGATWTTNIPVPLGVGTKVFVSTRTPVLAFDRTGVAYLAAIGEDAKGQSYVVVYRSIDNGRSWDGVVVNPDAAAPSQSAWLAVDASGGSYDGSVYAVWTMNDPMEGSLVHIARSRDGGATFTEAEPIHADGASSIMVSGDGKVFVTYVAPGAFEYDVVRSDDGGAKFGIASRVASINPPSAAARHFAAGDISPTATRGNIYFAFPNGNDLLMTHSNDNGSTWSAPLELTMSGTMPAIGTDPVTGEVTVTWLETSAMTARLWTARSVDGGVTFTNAHAVSDPFDLTANPGDHDQIAAYNGTSIAVFADSAGHLAIARLRIGVIPPPPTGRRRAARP